MFLNWVIVSVDIDWYSIQYLDIFMNPYSLITLMNKTILILKKKYDNHIDKCTLQAFQSRLKYRQHPPPPYFLYKHINVAWLRAECHVNKVVTGWG